MTDLKLYSMPSSGNSYKVRLLLALLQLRYTHVALEEGSAKLERVHQEGWLPFGKLPVLELVDGTRMPESNAILCYLANGTALLPDDPARRAHVLAWMFWEQNQHEGVIAVRAALRSYPSRAHEATPDRMADLLNRGHEILGIMEGRLQNAAWLTGDRPTVADVSLYAYTHTADSRGGYDLERFPAIRAWLQGMAEQPGYVGLDHVPG
ncbi:MAG: glutathione S-transferase family protein [Boseongicola sp. SB0676_bin_33]|nr:glutathione S-transferase family protein [Boseongicola sp. SB0676_bin_33]